MIGGISTLLVYTNGEHGKTQVSLDGYVVEAEEVFVRVAVKGPNGIRTTHVVEVYRPTPEPEPIEMPDTPPAYVGDP